MYELCNLLATKKTKKPRKPAKKSIRIGCFAILTINGSRVKITAKDERYKSAYFVEFENGNALPFSVSRDVLIVE